MHDSYVLKVLLIVSIATLITRCIIMLLPSKYSASLFLQRFNAFFPAIILFLLIVYSVQDAQWNIKKLKSLDFAYAEILGIGTTALVHIVAKRRVLLSIISGTGVYMLMHVLG